MSVSPSVPSTSAVRALDVRLGVVRSGTIAVEQRAALVRPLGLDASGFTDAASLVVLRATGDGASLRVTCTARLRLGRDGATERMVLYPTSAALPLRLGDQVRIDVDDAVLLVQLLPHRDMTRVERASEPFPLAEFRPLLIEADDPLYLGLVSFFGAVAAALLVVVAQMPPVPDTVTEAQYERIVRTVTVPLDLVEPDPEPVPDDASEVADNKRPVPAPVPAPEPEPEPVPELDRLADSSPVTARDRRVEQLERRSAVLGRMDQIASMLGDPDREAALEQALDAIDTTSHADAKGGGATGLRGLGGRQDGREDASVDWGGPPTGPGGTGRKAPPALEPVPDRAPVRRKAKVAMAPPANMQAGVLDLVASRYRRQLEACYIRQLNTEPNLAGRVVLEFEVEGGRVVLSDVTENTTRSAGFASCIEKRSARWTFASDAEGAYALPLLFEPG